MGSQKDRHDNGHMKKNKKTSNDQHNTTYKTNY